MPNYRRNYVQGGTYFFTVNLQNRKSSLLTDQIELLRSVVHQTKSESPFQINAWVVLPDHMHCIWTLPRNDKNFPGRWKQIKTLFCYRLRKNCKGTIYRKIWQRGYWEHTIKSESDFAAHLNYVHINPVKHGHVAKVVDWPYSTFHYYVSKGFYQKGWAGENERLNKFEFGE
jgi:putative transposase